MTAPTSWKGATIGDKTLTYAYNGDGLRIGKTVNGATSISIWDGDQVVLELNSAGAVANKYVRDINLLTVEDGAGTNKKYYLFNGHGDIVQLSGIEQENAEILMMDVEEENIREENRDSIFTIAQAKKKLEDIVSSEGLRYGEMLSRIVRRDELIKEMRKSSSLTLKELGTLFWRNKRIQGEQDF